MRYVQLLSSRRARILRVYHSFISRNIATLHTERYIQNAKLGLPIDNTAPLTPDHFAFEDADWGQDTESEFVDAQYDESQSINEASWSHPSDLKVDHYFQEDEANGVEIIVSTSNWYTGQENTGSDSE